LWVESGIIETAFETGTEYWLSLSGYARYDGAGNRVASSPYVRCIELRRAKVGVQSFTWSKVKTLFK